MSKAIEDLAGSVTRMHFALLLIVAGISDAGGTFYPDRATIARDLLMVVDALTASLDAAGFPLDEVTRWAIEDLRRCAPVT